MDAVTVTELKARLSHCLREVREGRSFTVLSRDIPVATLGPYESGDVDDLEVIRPSEDPALRGQIDLPPLALSRDIVDYLIEVGEDRDFGLGAAAGPEGRAPRAPGGAGAIGAVPGAEEVEE